jgi:DNA-binding transcriptional LysR family regulator
MLTTHEYLATVPFDLYELNLFHLVAKTGSFTKAGQQAGLTQSAITRQIRGMEKKLGVTLFERTTRQVHLTLAGEMLFEKSSAILQATNDVLHQLQHAFHLVPRTLRVGFARSIGLAYLPGYFFQFQRKHPEVQLNVAQKTSAEILRGLETRELDAGLLCPPKHLPRGLQITHRFRDEFTLIVPPSLELPESDSPIPLKRLKKLLAGQRWLALDRHGNTGQQLTQWLTKQDWKIEPAMELDSYDTIVNLVSLGLGVSLVPHRVLPIYQQRREVRRVLIKPTFERELAVVVRKSRKLPEPLDAFVENVLF